MGMRARAGYSAAAYSPEPHEMAGAAGHRPRHTRWAVAAVDCFLPRPATAVGDEALRQWASAVDASMDSVSDAANGGGCNSLIDEGQSAQSHDLNKNIRRPCCKGFPVISFTCACTLWYRLSHREVLSRGAW